MAEANAQGGRAGFVETAEAGFNLQFKAASTDKRPGLTPEHLLGAAWAARFNGAVNCLAKESGHADAGIAVMARGQLQPDGPPPFSVERRVSIPDLDEPTAQPVRTKTRARCAYFKATRGKASVKITLD